MHAVEAGERPVVDDGPHRDAGARAIQHGAEHDGDEQRDPDRDDAVPGRGDVTDLDALAVVEEER
jgi:hypothetical protein